MIDFHTHILPNMDDGAGSAEESAALLQMEAEQGVRHVFLTSHFYADEEEPSSFLRRRSAACKALQAASGEGLAASGEGKYSLRRGAPAPSEREQFGIAEECEARQSGPSLTANCSLLVPQIHLASEVYYFPGISDCAEIKPLALGETGCLLIEPPMTDWTSLMLDEIESIGPNLGLVPVIAHVDRYCRILKDYSLFDLLKKRRVLIQVNASFFLHGDTRSLALELLEEGRIHLIGSDCHNTRDRLPNIGEAAAVIREAGSARALGRCVGRMYELLGASR